MDKQLLISLDTRESKIVKDYAEVHKLSKYNAVKMIIREWGENLK